MSRKQKLYLIADQLHHEATMGHIFSGNIYEEERSEKLLKLSKEILNLLEDNKDEIEERFETHRWSRISPVIGVDAYVFNPQGELLLIRRKDSDKWAVPGGIAQVGHTLAESAVIELWEEAGLRGQVIRMVGAFDSRFWGSGKTKFHGVHMSFLVACDDFNAIAGAETLDARFFSREEITRTPLHPGHDKRIPATFKAIDDNSVVSDLADSKDMDLPDHQRS